MIITTNQPRSRKAARSAHHARHNWLICLSRGRASGRGGAGWERSRRAGSRSPPVVLEQQAARPGAEGFSVGGPYALATAALLPEAIASVCVFATLALYGPPGLDFTNGMSYTNVEANNRSAAIAWVCSHM